MRIFQSSLSYGTFKLIDDYCPNVKINLLRSFNQNDNETFKILEDFPHLIDKKILDSGVWTKFTHPESVKHEVEDYGKFLLEHADKFDIYFNYDEDFRELLKDSFSNKNEDNQRYLESLGLRPIPVLHNLKEDEVGKYLELHEDYPCVAIGSNAIKDKDFKKTVKILKKSKIKVHAFKIGSADKLKGLHAWSADCSSHAQWTKAGRIVLYDNEEKKDKSLSFRPFNKKGKINEDYFRSSELYDSYIYFLESFVGVEMRALTNDSNYRTFANSIYFWWLERYITCRNRIIHKIGFDDDIYIDYSKFINPFA
jgi:hypothetical protein